MPKLSLGRVPCQIAAAVQPPSLVRSARDSGAWFCAWCACGASGAANRSVRDVPKQGARWREVPPARAGLPRGFGAAARARDTAPLRGGASRATCEALMRRVPARAFWPRAPRVATAQPPQPCPTRAR